MADTFGNITQKRDYYLQMMQKARKLNDQILMKLILKKLAHLSMISVASATSGCMIIQFPTVQCLTKWKEYEHPTWWTLFKLTLAIPGSFVALLLLAVYRVGQGVY